MGTSNPWSPDWRPDPTGGRLIAIRAARRGALLAGVLYLPVGIAAALTVPERFEIEVVAIAVGLPGVALLGAGLAPAAIGSRIDAVVVGIALAIGAPVASVASLVISGFVVDSWVGDSSYFAAPFLRAGVLAALRVAPLVALGAAVWVLLVRRLSPPLPPQPPTTPPAP